MATNQYTLIQFTSITKRGRRVVSQEPCWLATCAFTDGPGMTVKKMTTTRDIAKAARFSLATAHNIAVQFSHLPASLVRADGTVLAPETDALRAEQARRRDERRRITQDVNRQFSELLLPIMEALR